MLRDRTVYTEKVANKAFLLDKYDLEPTGKGEGKKETVEESREHMAIKFDNIDKLEEYKRIQTSYESCLKLNQMWNAYIGNLIGERYLPGESIFGSDNADSICEKLIKSDFNGAIVFVINSPNATDVGLAGIVLLETKRTFVLLTKENTRKSTCLPI